MSRHVNRTDKTYWAYQEYKKQQREGYKDEFSFHEDEAKIIKDYEHWFIRENKFPYDHIFEKHHMLVPRRVISSYEDMTKEEKEEYLRIREEVAHIYDGILENFPSAKSVHAHFHPHLFVWKNLGEGKSLI